MKGRVARIGLTVLPLWAFYIGLQSQDHLLMWCSFFVFFTIFWAGLTVAATGIILRKAMAGSSHPSRVVAFSEEETMTGWHCRVPSWLPLAVFSSTLNGSETRFERHGSKLSEFAHFSRRRLEPALHRSFVISDFLGLIRWSFEETREVPLRILPVTDSSRGLAPPVGVVTGADLPSPYAAETGDRLDMRRYRKGDPLRLVLWSIYQRSGHLMVRAPEKAVSQHQRTGLYLLTGPLDSPAAKLSRVLLEKEALGAGWRFGADGIAPWAEYEQPALDALADSGQDDAAVRVHDFLRGLARDRFGKCLILVAPDAPGRNHKLAMLAHGESLPRLSLEIWVVYDPPEVPQRNTFPAVAGAQMLLVERKGPNFSVVTW